MQVLRLYSMWRHRDEFTWLLISTPSVLPGRLLRLQTPREAECPSKECKGTDTASIICLPMRHVNDRSLHLNILPLGSRLTMKVPNCFRMSTAYAQIVRARSVSDRLYFGKPAVKLGRQPFEQNPGSKGRWMTRMRANRS
jgi:hypothetical protein